MTRKAGQPYPWYRMYTEARTDTKLRALTKPQHYVWFNLLCLSADQDDRGVIIGYESELLAVEVADGDETLLAETIERLVKFRILEVVDGGWRFINFMARQYDKPSDTPEETSSRKRESRANAAASRDVTLGHAMSRPSHAASRIDTDAEEDAEPEGEIQPPPSEAGKDLRQRQQRARAHTHETPREPPQPGDVPADADESLSSGPPSADVADAADLGLHPPLRRASHAVFAQRFADAAGLAPADRGQALDAIIALYRPRAPDGALIIEANSFRDYFAKRKRREVDCRLLGNWLAGWWQRQRRRAEQSEQAEREDIREGINDDQQQQQQSPVAAATAAGQSAGRASSAGYAGRASGRGRRHEMPDPTANGRWAAFFHDGADDDEVDGDG